MHNVDFKSATDKPYIIFEMLPSLKYKLPC